MNENNYSVFESVEPPELFKDNPEILKSVITPNIDFEENANYSDLNTLGIENPFQSLGYTFSNFPQISYNYQKEEKKSSKQTSYKNHKEYTETMYPILYNALENNGIDGNTYAPILVAMTAHESGWRNEFSRRTNNYAGIKGKGSGTVKTKEWSPEKGYYTINSSFKSYNSIEDFADDYVKKLKNRFKAFQGSPSEFVSNIKRNGYFTAPLNTYLNSVNRILKEIILYG